ncbi:MAG: GEVED domain-containing protein, partial [Ferrimonas sp.]
MRSILLLGVLSGAGYAMPFEQCPTQAFLFQDPVTKVYGVDLATGKSQLLSVDLGISGTNNAVGFNQTDRYVYGFNKDHRQVIRVGQDLQAELLPVQGLPSGVHFFVGDVFNNQYWLYRKNLGLYRIELDPNAADYLVATKLTGADTFLNLTDFAFHPSDGYLYAVDNNLGQLFQIDPADGWAFSVADLGIQGTFGAAYFEQSGFMYISRNSDGQIFRIDVRDGTAVPNEATLFAYGPASGQNDGARCANAPVTPSNVDFGDAPASYGTLLADNGARHSVADNNPTLGQSVDTENDGQQAPFSDDIANNNELDDEDGVLIMTAMEAGQKALALVTVTGRGGYLQGFFDWNRDGQFDEQNEWAIYDHYLSEGEHRVLFDVPNDVHEGSSFARFRFSSLTGVGAIGGAADGEVEDYPVAFSHNPVSYRYYPSAGEWATLAFEDHWPRQADYDMNDLVLGIRITEVWQQRQL